MTLLLKRECWVVRQIRAPEISIAGTCTSAEINCVAHNDGRGSNGKDNPLQDFFPAEEPLKLFVV
jgi:hypothetical protein